MGIKLIDNFEYKGKKYLDSRQSVANLAALKAISENMVPAGFRAYVKETGRWYEYDPSATADATTGKWRAAGGGNLEEVTATASATVVGVNVKAGGVTRSAQLPVASATQAGVITSVVYNRIDSAKSTADTAKTAAETAQTKAEAAETAAGNNGLNKVEFTPGTTQGTVAVTTAGGTSKSCVVPAATTSKAGLLTAADKTKLGLMETDIMALEEAVWPLAVTLKASPATVEVGASTSVALSWTATLKGADVVESSTVTLDGTAVTGKSKTLTVNPAATGDTPHTLSVTKGTRVKTASASVKAVHASYFGAVAATWTPTETAVKALAKVVNPSRAYTKSGVSMTNGKSVFAYPSSMGELTSVKDGNGYEVLGSFTKSTVTVGGVAYLCYALTVPVTADGITLKFS